MTGAAAITIGAVTTARITAGGMHLCLQAYDLACSACEMPALDMLGVITHTDTTWTRCPFARLSPHIAAAAQTQLNHPTCVLNLMCTLQLLRISPCALLSGACQLLSCSSAFSMLRLGSTACIYNCGQCAVLNIFTLLGRAAACVVWMSPVPATGALHPAVGSSSYLPLFQIAFAFLV